MSKARTSSPIYWLAHPAPAPSYNRQGSHREGQGQQYPDSTAYHEDQELEDEKETVAEFGGDVDQPEGDDEEAQEQEPNPEAFDEEQHKSDGEPGEDDEEKDQGHSAHDDMTRTMKLVDRRKRTRTWTRMTAVTINMSQRADDGNNERTADMGRRDCQ
jgi:hypothetical protein